ncbi:MAG: GtrA family protein [Desulfovibrio sp.]|nr:GtrA family protein [Desulfovibrio sp.]
MSKIHSARRQFVRFCCVGVVNTVLSLAVIFSLTWAGLWVYWANATGYVIGIIASYVLNSRYSFGARMTLRRFLKFLLTCGLSYAGNILAIHSILAASPSSIYASQFIGMIVYTAIGFLLNKFYAMK